MIKVELHNSVLSRSHTGKPHLTDRGTVWLLLLGCPRLPRGTIPGKNRISGSSQRHNRKHTLLIIYSPASAFHLPFIGLKELNSPQLLLALMINSLTVNISVNDAHLSLHHSCVPEPRQRQRLSLEPCTSTGHVHQPRTETWEPHRTSSTLVPLRLLLVVFCLLTKTVFGPFPGGWSQLPSKAGPVLRRLFGMTYLLHDPFLQLWG